MAFKRPWPNTLIGVSTICVFAAFTQYYLAYPQPDPPIDLSLPKFNNSTNRNVACIALAAELPESVYSSQHPIFHQSSNAYWSTNACEAKPSCIVRPTNAQEVSIAVKVLKAEFDTFPGSIRFAVRSGGHSPEAGFGSVKGGVVIDMALFNSVTVAEDFQTTEIGVGAKWVDVSAKLDHLGLAVAGGRNSNVGVGGLVLGGGISLFSPRFGMVCDNIESYEIVLANGTITQVSSSQHGDLWRALKGGAGNFGIVTHITAKSFLASKVWSGYGLWAYGQVSRVLKAFVDFNEPENFDKFAAGPIVALTYVQALGIKLIAANFAYSKPQKWAPVFDGFKSVWRVWSTTKIQSLSDSTRELHRMAAYGSRQFQITTTVKNDLETLEEMKDLYGKKLREAKNIKGGVWAFVFQPLSAVVTRKGSPNVLGLESRGEHDTLIIVLLTVAWKDTRDDDEVYRLSRELMHSCEELAEKKGTADKFRYLNYAASGQDPFEGYGTENKRFMQEVSRNFDPEGFFQRGREGGFKLGMF